MDANFQTRVIIGGLPRSGSTLLRFILDTSSNVVGGPETSFFTKPLWQHLARRTRTVKRLQGKLDLSEEEIDRDLVGGNSFDVFDRFMRRYATQCEKAHVPVWIEKTPQNCFSYERLVAEANDVERQLDCKLGVKFVSTIRNGLDVITSKRLDGRGQDGEYWCSIQCYIDSLISVYGFRSPDHIIMRYEDLVENPEQEIASLCNFLGIPFETSMTIKFNEWSASRNPEKVQQPKLASAISADWVGRYKAPEFAERIDEFRKNERAMYWLKKSGYDDCDL